MDKELTKVTTIFRLEIWDTFVEVVLIKGKLEFGAGGTTTEREDTFYGSKTKKEEK